MVGRNDRRRSNEMRSRSGRPSARRSSREAGTSRPVSGSSRTARNAQRTAREPQRSQSAQRETQWEATGSVAAVRGGRNRGKKEAYPEPEVISTSVGQLRRADRLERAKKKSRRRLIMVVAVIAVVVVVLAGWAALYNSPAFKIENVEVNGVEHLTSEEMAQLANVPNDTTLLRVDTGTIEARVEQNAWVADAQVVRAFPNTLQINVTERPVFAVVEIPTGATAAVKKWLVAEDHVWLMPVPDESSEAAKTTSAKVYEDEKSVLHIVDVPFGTKAEIGKECVDANVNNALDILSGLTTELSGRVTKVSAAGTAETTLVLDNGVEVAFGKAEDIRDKERVILEILAQNPDNVSYINVRMVNSPTWRSV